MRRPFFTLLAPLALVLLILAHSPATRADTSSTIEQPFPFNGPLFQVEELTAQLHSDNTVVTVAGKIRNLSHKTASGHVIVHFTDANGAVVYATEAAVNKNSPFSHGDTGSFETSVNTKDTPGTQNVAVEFVTSGH